MVERALSYPLKGTGKLRTILGGASIYFGWLVFPVIFLIGYYIQTLVFASTGQEEPPPFANVLTLSKLGSVGAVITFMYSGLFIAGPMILLGFITPSLLTPDSWSSLSTAVLTFTAAISIFTASMSLILPIILCQYGRTGDFRTAYNVKRLIELIKTHEVLKAMAGTVILTLAFAVAVTLLTAITLGLGLLVLPFLLIWYMLVTAYLYGNAIGRVTGTVNTIEYSDLVDEINANEDSAV